MCVIKCIWGRYSQMNKICKICKPRACHIVLYYLEGYTLQVLEASLCRCCLCLMHVIHVTDNLGL